MRRCRWIREHAWKTSAQFLAHGRYPTCDHCYYLPGIWITVGLGPCLPPAPLHPLNPSSGSCHPASPAAMLSPESPETGPAHPAFSSIPSLSQLAPLCSPPVFPEPCLPGSIPYGLEDRLPLPPGQLWSPPLWVHSLCSMASVCCVLLTSMLSAKQSDRKFRSEHAKWPLGLKRITAAPAVQQNLSQERRKIFLLFSRQKKSVSLGMGSLARLPVCLIFHMDTCRPARRLLPMERWRDGRRPAL